MFYGTLTINTLMATGLDAASPCGGGSNVTA